MDIIFYKSTNEVNSFPKTLTDGVTISGSLRSECDILNPVIEFTGIGVDIPYNYCYIPTFKRYYFITQARSIRNSILEISMHVDVLQSWSNEILNLNCVVERNEYEKDPYIYDNMSILKYGDGDTNLNRQIPIAGRTTSDTFDLVDTTDDIKYILRTASYGGGVG